VVWCVTGPGIHGELQSLMCWCVVGQTTNVAEAIVLLFLIYFVCLTATIFYGE